MVGSVVVESAEGFQPSYALGPVTAHFWGLHQDPDPDINPKEKDMNKVLLVPCSGLTMTQQGLARNMLKRLRFFRGSVTAYAANKK